MNTLQYSEEMLSPIPALLRPKHLIIELTDRCNLKCEICWREKYEEAIISGPGTFMKIEEVRRLEPFIRDAELISIFGFGETLLHPSLEEILEYIYSINSRDNLIQLVTNGAALNKRKAPLLGRQLHLLSISLNASNAERYWREMYPHEFRAKKDVRFRFQNVLDGITEFSEALPSRARDKLLLTFVAHRENYQDMADFVRIARSVGVSRVNIQHYRVNRPEFIDRSLFWIKEDYNSEVDRAMDAGEKLEVSVFARRFFVEPKVEFNPERDCDWPTSTTIVGVKGDVLPCCYGGRVDFGNAFTSSGGLDEIWNSDNYQKLRKKRDLPACKTCNLVLTFDDFDCHFDAGMKIEQSFLEKQTFLSDAEAARKTATKLSLYANRFRDAGVDFDLFRHSSQRLGLSIVQGLSNESSESEPNFEKVASTELQALNEAFCKTKSTNETHVNISLAKSFLGAGWGLPNRNEHGQSWRWLTEAKHGALVFLNLLPGKDYVVRSFVHTASNQEIIDAVTVTANDAPVRKFQCAYHGDRLRYLFTISRKDIPESGHVTLRYYVRQKSNQISAIALSEICLEPAV